MLQSKTARKVFSIFLLILFLSVFLSLMPRLSTAAACGDQRSSWEETATDIVSHGRVSAANETGLEGAPFVSLSYTVCAMASLSARHICRAPPESVL